MHYEFSIYHRDIKPSNILYIDGIYKLADFGSSKIAEQIHSLTNNYSLKVLNLLNNLLIYILL